MTEIYSEQDYESALKQKKIVMAVFFTGLAVYLLAMAGLLVYYLFLPYRDPAIVWVKVGSGVLSALFVSFAFVFGGIKMKRVRKYCRMLGFARTALVESWTGEFLRFDEETQDKEGVDYYCMVLSEWYDKKEVFYERKVLVDCEKPHPDVKLGDIVSYETQGNVLLRYEVTGHNDERTEDRLN